MAAKKQNRRIGAKVRKTINLGDYNSVSYEAFIETDVDEKISIEDAMGELWEACEEEIDGQIANYDPEEDDTKNTVSDPVEEPEPELEEEMEDLTEEMIDKMTQEELIDLCETTEGLESIDTSLKPKILRVMIVDALFDDGADDAEDGKSDPEDDNGTEGVAGDDEWGDDDWNDDE